MGNESTVRIYLGRNTVPDEHLGLYAFNIVDGNLQLKLFPHSYDHLLTYIARFIGDRPFEILPYDGDQKIRPFSNRRCNAVCKRLEDSRASMKV